MKKVKTILENNGEEFVPDETGSELLLFSEDLHKTIGKLKELETSSESNSKIGLRVIQDSINRLAQLEEDIQKQIEALQNNFTEN